ncbi:TfoX/Sxy family DNA transformation protein [Rhodococcus sp. X156]|uniref:TfoX/Sxy family DNA transformation protein n=1 Tax=Rhodococcus sp. X156 TaxID=2499145 RepID=UPI0013E36865|nr:TfoX/Sxy family DNA transformation protein [Rhodococcus sp. X156]
MIGKVLRDPRRTGSGTPLEEAENISPALANDLRWVGVPDLESLREAGAVEVCARLEAEGLIDCTYALVALEGAIQGVPHEQLGEDVAERLSRLWAQRCPPRGA